MDLYWGQNKNNSFQKEADQDGYDKKNQISVKLVCDQSWNIANLSPQNRTGSSWQWNELVMCDAPK